MWFTLRHKFGIAVDNCLCFDENVAVCNNYEDGKWGNEERSEFTLFKRGELLQVCVHSFMMPVKVENIEI